MGSQQGEDAMRELRTAGMSMVLYLAALGAIASVAVAGGYAGLTSLASASDQSVAAPSSERTRLEQVVANSREINAALRKPLPALEPLGPIVHKPARAGVSRIVVSPKPKLSREANDAFAADWPQPQRTATSSYDAYDRNRPQ